MKHIKWIFTSSRDAKQIAGWINELFESIDVKIYKSKIIDGRDDKVYDVWTMEFNISEDCLKTLVEIMELSEVNAYTKKEGE